MKKIFAIALMFAMIISITACGSENNNSVLQQKEISEPVSENDDAQEESILEELVGNAEYLARMAQEAAGGDLP